MMLSRSVPRAIETEISTICRIAPGTMHEVFEDELHEHFQIPKEFGVVVTIPVGFPLGYFGEVSRIRAEQKPFLNQ